MRILLLVAFMWSASVVPAVADSADMRHVVFSHHADSRTVHVTVAHGDMGWKHYADAWRLVTAADEILATRVLYHPHVDEQPFTRSLTNVELPEVLDVIYVEAHCNVHGWGEERLKVDLRKAAGPRFNVNP